MEGKVSDLEGNYYVDKRCEELEELLRSSRTLCDFTVMRRRKGDIKRGSDAYVIQDAKEESGFDLEAWEVDALTESELLLYIEMKLKKDDYDSVKRVAIFEVIRGIPILLTGIFLPYGILGSSDDSAILLIFGIACAIISLPVIIFSEVLYQRRKASYVMQQDLRIVRENPTYINVLRKLATVPESELVYPIEHVKRLMRLEAALSENQT